MIRINLLPVRAAKKKESIRFQLTVASLITFFVVALSAFAYVIFQSEASALTQEIASGEEEMNELKKKIGELAKIKEQKRIVEEKLQIIASLEKARTGPVNLFKNISMAIPEKAWLSSLMDQGNIVVLKGYAVTEETVADFMRGLERFPELGRVELEVAERINERETGIDVVSFTIRLEKG